MGNSDPSMEKRPGPAFLLGEWTVDPVAGTVARGEESIRLEPKVMAVLVHLVDHAGEVVTKEQILDHVWPDSFVAEAALSRCISELRRVLGDDAKKPRYIETIPKRGYRLIADTSRPVQPDIAPETDTHAARWPILLPWGPFEPGNF